MRTHSRFKRILNRIPLRLGLLGVRFVALFSHRFYMLLLLPILKYAGCELKGKPRYISPKVFFDDFDKLTFGDRVVISSEVSLLTHDYSLTTLKISANEYTGKDVAVIKPIVIGNNVFVGRGAILMPGTTIEDNVIVGAGSVVRGLVKSGSIVVGNPAEVVKTFDEQIEKMRLVSGNINIRQDR